MIETTIFSTGDIAEVKAWLDDNAEDIFDSITLTDAKTITCTIGGVNSLVLDHNNRYMSFTITLNNGTSFHRTSSYVETYTKAYKTDNGIFLCGHTGRIFNICATKFGEIYGGDGNGEVHKVGQIESPTFTDLTAPTLFNVTTLCPAPYNNVTVSQDILIPIWSQIVNVDDTSAPQIVQINDTNYVFDGYICLKE